MHILMPVNFPPFVPPNVTAVRLWLFGEVHSKGESILARISRRFFGTAAGRWDDHLTCRCPNCGKLFGPPEPVVEIGMEGAAVIRKGLWLSDSAYAEPRLLAPCPHCSGALKFNPFVVDNST